jgi:Domain of unknown function (DUF4440)
MKKYIAAALLLFIVLNTNGQKKKETAVAAAAEQLRLAMISGNRAALEAITAPQLSYGHSSGTVESQKDFVEKIASGKSDFVRIDITEQTISISSKTAIVRHQLLAATNDGGKPGEVKLKVLQVWQKQRGGWKLLARQAVKMIAAP